MNIRHKTVYAILAAALLLAGCWRGDFLYTVSAAEDGSQRVSIAKYTGYKTDVIIPDVIKGIPVTSIDDYAFYNNKLTSVTIPKGVTEIGDYAFYGNQLTSVTIPEGVTEIGDSAFHANQLTSVTIPPGITEISDGMFGYNLLSRVIIPEGVTYIGGSAFEGNLLSSLTIPESVTYIGYNAFHTNQLTSVIIPPGVTEISDGMFGYNLLSSVIIPEGVTYIGGSAFEGNLLSSLTIPESVTYIGSEAFSNNKLSSVTILKGAARIEQGAFTNNPLSSVTIPDSRIVFDGDPFPSNALNLYLALNDFPGGLYEDKDDIWYRNGKAVTDVRLVYGSNVYITEIDGRRGTSAIGNAPRDLHWRYFKDDVYLDAGFHTIKAAYFSEDESGLQRYTKDGTAFEQLLESGIYDLTAEVENVIAIRFQIEKRR